MNEALKNKLEELYDGDWNDTIKSGWAMMYIMVDMGVTLRESRDILKDYLFSEVA